MQTENRFLDDLARVAGGAFGTLAGLRNEIEDLVRQRFERMLSDMDLVPREEFDAVRAVAEKARLEQERLEKRVVALEKALASPAPKAASRARTGPASGKKTAKKREKNA
jgi:BMFP domain-containing protein YqiC